MNESTYYLLKSDAPEGPYTLIQLRGMWLSGAVNGAMQYCEAGATEWRPLGEIQGVLEKTALGKLTGLGILGILLFAALGFVWVISTHDIFGRFIGVMLAGILMLVCWRYARLSPGEKPKDATFTPLQWVLILIAFACFVLALCSWLAGQ